MTYTEVKFWKKVRNYSMMGYDFDRQKPILDYIVDFYCDELKLIIEIDGITHDSELAINNDETRDARLSALGFTVIRFPALQVVHDMKNIIRTLENYIEVYELKNGVHQKAPLRREKGM